VITDRCPVRGPRRNEYARSDAMTELRLPEGDAIRSAARTIVEALEREERRAVLAACEEFLVRGSAFYGVRVPPISVLGARPKRVRRSGSTWELFADYHHATCEIRIWMRTAVRKAVTSPAGFISTLCHEFCHHLDRHHHGFPGTPHTRGFYERAGALYHHALETPRKALFWMKRSDGRQEIDWRRVRAQRAPPPPATAE
jgi:hypothetical protein